MTALPWKSGGTGFFNVGGHKLEYAMHGSGGEDLPTIVMLHEGLGSASTWKQFPEQVSNATGHRVFVYSRAGYGKSSRSKLPLPLDYMTREALDVLPGVLELIDAQTYVLLGHSDGASIAAIYAGSMDDHRVRGLILMAPHFFTEPEGLSSIANARTEYEERELKSKLSRHHSNVDNAFYGWNEAWLDPEFKSWDITEVIDYWRVPTLGIQGANDEYGSLKQIDVMIDRSYAPVDQLIIPDCGHAPHRDKPTITISGIAEFLERLDRIETVEVKTA